MSAGRRAEPSVYVVGAVHVRVTVVGFAAAAATEDGAFGRSAATRNVYTCGAASGVPGLQASFAAALTVTVIVAPFAKACAWVTVRTIPLHEYDRGPPADRVVAPWVDAWSIASENVIWTAAGAARALVAHGMLWAVPPVQQPPAAGAGTKTVGGLLVGNVHGFGAAPPTSGFPAVSWAATVIVYGVPPTNRVACVQVAMVFVGLFQVQLKPPVTTGFGVTEIDPVFIAFLNVTPMLAERATPAAPLAGTVLMICGLGQIVVNDHGLGTAPGTSGKSSPAARPAICI